MTKVKISKVMALRSMVQYDRSRRRVGLLVILIAKIVAYVHFQICRRSRMSSILMIQMSIVKSEKLEETRKEKEKVGDS